MLIMPVLGACLVPDDGLPDVGPTIAIVSGNQQGAPLQQVLPQPLVVGVFDGGGKPLQGARVAWAVTHGRGRVSTDTTTASEAGLSEVVFTVGDAAGTDSVRASLVETPDAVTFAIVAGESRSPWPAEPPGFTVLTDWAYNLLATAIDGSFTRGSNVWNQRPGTGLAAIVPDRSAPLSPPNVAQLTYPVGLPSGSEPWNLYFNPTPGREFYTGFWWKASADWQGDPSGINKILFWQDEAPSSANLIVMMNNQQQRDYFLTVTLEFNHATNEQLANSTGAGGVRHVFGNVNGGNFVIVPDQWYRIELYFKGSTTPTSQDGTLRWWATKLGEHAPAQIGDYRNVNFDTSNFIQFSFAPTWGGNSGVAKLHTDYYRIDHVHISQP